MTKNLSSGNHRGYDWFTVQSRDSLIGQWINGYVVMPSTHPWYRINYDSIPVDVHGGVTYSAYDENVRTLGFDTLHPQDIPSYGGTKKTLEYVENECKSLCEQMYNAK